MGYNTYGSNEAMEENFHLDRYYALHYKEGASMLDGLPEELKEVVDPHWGQFPPQHPFVAHVGGICYLFLTALSIFGNGLVMYIFLKCKKLRSPTNMFIVNLAFSDFGMMLTQGFPVGVGIFMSPVWPYGAFACKLYACLGNIFGVSAIVTMVVIGYDRYNVIVKGFSGTKITAGKAAIVLLFIWVYVVAISIPPFFGWGGYASEGVLVTCTYDYLKDDWNHKSFMLWAFTVNYCFPLCIIIYFYSGIVKAVVSHERAMKAQAKKMNVESLKSGAESAESAEMKIAKVAITNVMLWFSIWTPYACVTMIGQFGNRSLITPLVSQLPAFLAKTASVINPFVFAVSHPKYREALAIEVPCLGIGNETKVTEEQTVTAKA